MPRSALALVLQRLRRRAAPPGAGGTSDGLLLERFAASRDESAFEALLERHGPMVWNVCQRVLANPSGAEDAFQATFLVLVRKAKSIAKRDSVGSWLHGVAYRIALDARARAARRTRQSPRPTTPAEEPPEATARSEVRQILDAELGWLPEKYRAPLVLCYLEGKTNDEAADLLGTTRGTIAGRLSRARDLLRGRLTRRGLAPSSVGLALMFTQEAAVPATLLGPTLKAALGYAATGAAPPSVAALVEGALRKMFITKLKITAVLLAAVVVLGTSAGWAWHNALGKPPSADPKPPAPRPLVLADNPAQAKADRPALVRGNTTFAWDLYGQLRKKEGNVIYSPYSISTALAMTYAGARNKTAEEMAEVLHFTLPQERLHPAAGALVRDLGGPGKKRNYQLRVANALWGQKDYGFLADYIALTRTVYGAGLTEVDFIRAREVARKTINAWVAKETEEKIKQLLKKEHLTPATVLVLTNAIYFKAEWETKFYKNATRVEPFQVKAEQKVKAPMMWRAGKFAYLDGGTFQMLELPYAGKALSMLVLLPKKADGLPELEKSLTADQLARWHRGLRETQVMVYLPKFKVASAFELKKTLKAMGMELAFSSKRADFSGMNGGRERLFIQDVIHQTFVDVNEEGTEAAGATAVVIGRSGPPPQGVKFRADHPFVFVVRDNRSGSALFVGRMADPTR
jgi:serpin B